MIDTHIFKECLGISLLTLIPDYQEDIEGYVHVDSWTDILKNFSDFTFLVHLGFVVVAPIKTGEIHNTCRPFRLVSVKMTNEETTVYVAGQRTRKIERKWTKIIGNLMSMDITLKWVRGIWSETGGGNV